MSARVSPSNRASECRSSQSLHEEQDFSHCLHDAGHPSICVLLQRHLSGQSAPPEVGSPSAPRGRLPRLRVDGMPIACPLRPDNHGQQRCELAPSGTSPEPHKPCSGVIRLQQAPSLRCLPTKSAASAGLLRKRAGLFGPPSA